MNNELEILRRQLAEARETNKRINREKQRLEAAVAEKVAHLGLSEGRWRTRVVNSWKSA